MLKYPVKITDIQTFEHANRLKINVMGIEKTFVYPVYLSQHNECGI